MSDTCFCTIVNTPKWWWVGLHTMFRDVFYNNSSQEKLTRSSIHFDLPKTSKMKTFEDQRQSEAFEWPMHGWVSRCTVDSSGAQDKNAFYICNVRGRCENVRYNQTYLLHNCSTPENDYESASRPWFGMFSRTIRLKKSLTRSTIVELPEDLQIHQNQSETCEIIRGSAAGRSLQTTSERMGESIQNATTVQSSGTP